MTAITDQIKHCSVKSKQQLVKYRERLLRLDTELIALLEERIAIAIEIGKIKHAEKIKVKQTAFWNLATHKRKEAVAKTKLNPDFVNELYEIIHKESIQVQENLFEK